VVIEMIIRFDLLGEIDYANLANKVERLIVANKGKLLLFDFYLSTYKVEVNTQWQHELQLYQVEFLLAEARQKLWVEISPCVDGKFRNIQIIKELFENNIIFLSLKELVIKIILLIKIVNKIDSLKAFI